jgi:hypothetical protein
MFNKNDNSHIIPHDNNKMKSVENLGYNFVEIAIKAHYEMCKKIMLW